MASAFTKTCPHCVVTYVLQIPLLRVPQTRPVFLRSLEVDFLSSFNLGQWFELEQRFSFRGHLDEINLVRS